MSGQELVDELRQWARPNTTHSEKLVNRAADTIEAQAKAVDTWAEMAARRHQALGEVEASYREAIARVESAERALRATDDFRIADWQKLELERDEAEQKSAELAAVIEKLENHLSVIEGAEADMLNGRKEMDALEEIALTHRLMRELLSAADASAVSAYTTRIREEAVRETARIEFEPTFAVSYSGLDAQERLFRRADRIKNGEI